MGDSLSNVINLTEFHVKYVNKGIHAVAEYGMINYENGPVEQSYGYYVDLGYNIGGLFDIEAEIIPWFRYSNYNTASSVRDNTFSDELYNVNKWLVGLAVKPNSNIIFKAEFGNNEYSGGKASSDLINLGMGYMF